MTLNAFNGLPNPFITRTLRACGCFFLLTVVLGGAMGCQTQAPDDSAWERFEYVEPEMGVDFHLKFYAPNRPEAERIARAAYARVEFLNGIFSDYNPSSELNRLGRAPVGEPVRVSSELFNILQRICAIVNGF